MSSIESSSPVLRIERPGIAMSLTITPEQQREIVGLAIYLLRGNKYSTVESASTETDREEIRLRTKLLLERNSPECSKESILRIATDLDALMTSKGRHLSIKLDERKRRYSELTERIGELNKDVSRCSDSENALQLSKRRTDLEKEREELVQEMSVLEEQLAREAA